MELSFQPERHAHEIAVYIHWSSRTQMNLFLQGLRVREFHDCSFSCFLSEGTGRVRDFFPSYASVCSLLAISSASFSLRSLDAVLGERRKFDDLSEGRYLKALAIGEETRKYHPCRFVIRE
uniref:(northern house mosquito) hypothetical protein n=1 Tax=Culex pipiens TaxID=7175 RepID=A0A8D8F0P3_CULPI